jgi:hypothetical protein
VTHRPPQRVAHLILRCLFDFGRCQFSGALVARLG